MCDRSVRPARARVLSVRACRRGFSLIELLVVVAIVGVLIGVVTPGLSRSRSAARSVSCLSKLRTLYLSTRLYADERRTLPVSDMNASIAALDLPAPAWRCPEDKAMKAPLSNTAYSSYTYLAPLYMDPPPTGIVLRLLKPRNGLRRYENNPLLPLLWDREDNHEKDRNVVYWNGRAERRNWE